MDVVSHRDAVFVCNMLLSSSLTPERTQESILKEPQILFHPFICCTHTAIPPSFALLMANLHHRVLCPSDIANSAGRRATEAFDNPEQCAFPHYSKPEIK